MTSTTMLLTGCIDWKEQVAKEQSFVVDFVAWMFSDVIGSILYTPYHFFYTDSAQSILMGMGVFSAGFVTLLAMIEGFKRMISVSYSPMGQVFARYPIALAVSAFAPMIFYYAGMFSNTLVDLIFGFMHITVGDVENFKNIFQMFGHFFMETLVSFILLIVIIYYFVKILIFHAIRWFGLVFNMVTTPIAMTAFMFKSYENVAGGWLTDTIGKFLVVVAQAIVLSMVIVLLYAPVDLSYVGAGEFFSNGMVKMLIAIGGLHVLLHPPNWLMRWFSGSYPQVSFGGMKQVAKFAIRAKTGGLVK